MDAISVIQRYITDELLEGSKTKIGADDELLGSDLLDSLALTNLIHFLQERFHISIHGREIVPDNFRTIRKIQAFIEKKQRATAKVS
jgi:acyl carrier protein